MWGVRRGDADRHNESGWLIRPETRSSSPSVFSFPLFIFVFSSYLPFPSHPPRSPYHILQARKQLSLIFLVLLTHPGQYGTVSEDGACFASDDLVIAPAWVNSLRLPIDIVLQFIPPYRPRSLCLFRSPNPSKSCFYDSRLTTPLQQTTPATAALASRPSAIRMQLCSPPLLKAQPSRTYGGMNSLSDPEKAKT